MSQKLQKYLPLIIGSLSLFLALFSLIYGIYHIATGIDGIIQEGIHNNPKYDYYQTREIILGVIYLFILAPSILCGINLIISFVKNKSLLPIYLKLTQMVFAFGFIVLFVCDMIIEQYVFISYPLFIVVAVLVITLGILSISKVITKKEQILSLIFGILSFTLLGLSQFMIDAIVLYSMALTFEAVGIYYIVSLVCTSSKKETKEENQVEDKQEEMVNVEPEAEEEFEEETPVEDDDLEAEEESEEETPVEDEELEAKEENEEKSEEPKKDDAFDVTAKVEAPNFD